VTPTSRTTVRLASASPRRRALLAQIGLACEVLPADVDERVRPGEAPGDYVRRLALAKARAARAQAGNGGAPVLAADTAVVIGGEILGKPASEADGARMLRRLSGATHQVLTAVAVISARGESLALSASEVEFRELTDAEIAAYWRSGEPVDKAGGYAVQGLGAVFIRALRGSFSGVVGLPLFETAALLAEHGIAVPATGAPA
jgi:septum formation protein